MALSFWLVFAAAVAVVAATGHAMTARWHLGPVEGLHFWTVLAFSPEILVFLFFMLTDPRTVPAGRRARLAFGVSVALARRAPRRGSPRPSSGRRSESSRHSTLVCATRPLAVHRAVDPAAAAAALVALLAGCRRVHRCLLAAGARHAAADPAAARSLPTQVARAPRVVVRPSKGVDSKLDRALARRIAVDIQRRSPSRSPAPRAAVARGSLRSVPRDRGPARRGRPRRRRSR